MKVTAEAAVEMKSEESSGISQKQVVTAPMQLP